MGGLSGLEQGAVHVEAGVGLAPVLVLSGELDLATVGAFRAELLAMARAHPSVAIDMTATTFIDGSVLGVLAGASAQFPDGVRVTGATGIVRRVFRLGNMEHLLAD